MNKEGQEPKQQDILADVKQSLKARDVELQKHMSENKKKRIDFATKARPIIMCAIIGYLFIQNIFIGIIVGIQAWQDRLESGTLNTYIMVVYGHIVAIFYFIVRKIFHDDI